MVGRYLDGSRPVHASDLLEDAAGRVLKQRESLAVRDSLHIAFLFFNFDLCYVYVYLFLIVINIAYSRLAPHIRP
jgi:hypothetical protein